MLRPAENESEAETESADFDGCSLPSLPARAAATVPTPRPTNAYGWPFWLSYLALASLMIAVSLMYRYADFITFLGGSELELGAVVGAGMVGSLLMRLAQGVGIDRYGPRHIWLGSTALFVVSMLGHLFVSRPGGVEIFLLQALYRTSVAGVFGAVFTFAFQQVPVHRMAEAVGTIGTASFLGMVIGPMIGDLVSGSGAGRPVQRTELNWLFLVASALGCVSFVAAWFATAREVRPHRGRHLTIIPLLRRYHPRVLLVVAIVTGLALGLPATFLRTFAAELHINRLAPYFTVYALTAIATRLVTRRSIDRLGIRPAILYGMAAIIAGMISYVAVAAEWQLMFPAILTGAGQAILYPAVVAGGSAAFPDRYRGVGTTLMLAAIDLGTLVGAPLVGGIVHYAKRIGLPGYSTMFISVAAILTVACLCYALASRPANAESDIRAREEAARFDEAPIESVRNT